MENRAEYKDILSAHLLEDKRVRGELVSKLKIYTDPMYDVSIRIYQGIAGDPSQFADLITVLVTYKQEKLRILAKLDSCEAGTVHDEMYIEKVILPRLQAEEKGPLHFVRDVKKWCRVPLTENDQIVLIKAGFSVG